MSKKISESAVRRLSLYLRTLEELDRAGHATVSSGQLAARSATTAAQVRKDLSLFGSFGKRGLGYTVEELARALRDILGLTQPWRVVLIGAGRIGSALLEYRGLAHRGFQIVAVLENDSSKIGREWGDSIIRDVAELEQVVRDRDVQIAILAVPVAAVQDVMDQASRAGVRGILNFAPVRLKVPEGVTVKDVNLVMELESLTFALSQGL
ncbi:MAG: redox-sensing transcriptional repressor Rex [Gemmatimonadota bacterium]|nr:MAG: redox-sensing transcriptional repressor Rex [Gemmatimonadota bacterium]